MCNNERLQNKVKRIKRFKRQRKKAFLNWRA
ncbi:hypothetical protein ADEMBY_34 [Bacillus phage Ademby]|nr:hypothetical protein ADEMBY_34 [Bacillus phage Ademby]